MSSFGKGLGIGLVVFIVLNFAFSLLISLLRGDLLFFFGALTNIGMLMVILFNAMIFPPFEVIFTLTKVILGILGIIAFPIDSGGEHPILFLLGFIGYFLIPLISALITGRLAGSKGASFGAWFLISIISTGIILVFLILGMIDPDTTVIFVRLQVLLFGELTATRIQLLISLIIIGVINSIFYGCFSVLMSKEEFF
ncbi:MAG: hypothetical protein ACTSYC_04615 [Promethearchaeota archaeon]